MPPSVMSSCSSRSGVPDGLTGLFREPLPSARCHPRLPSLVSRVPKRRRGLRPPPLDLEEEIPDTPEPTAQPRERNEPEEEDGDRLVPSENVGGAAPTHLGGDSGGDFPGQDDDLSSLIEPEPPESPEVGAVHVRVGEGPRGPRR